MIQPRPTIGRTVHYLSHGTPPREDGTQAHPSVCRAAMVTEVDEVQPDRVGLTVLNPTGTFFHPLGVGGSVLDPTRTAGGSWHWPERV